MGCVSGPLSWLTSGSDGASSLPEEALDPSFGLFEPNDAGTVLEDFGRQVTVVGLGTTCILYDELTFVDDDGTPVNKGRNYKLARFRRGVFGGARLSEQTLEIVNAAGTARSLFRIIGPIPRDTSLFDRYVLEPKRREAA